MLLTEDRALLDQFRRGDQTALLRVYRAFAPEVARFLRAGFGFNSGGRPCRFHGARPGFDLEDRVQDVFVRAFSESARLAYDGLSPYGPYLRTIARNLVIDDFRRKQRALEDFSIEPPETADVSAPDASSEPLLGQLARTGDPGEDLRRRELLDHLAAFQATLPPREKDVYRLRFVEEREHQDIAAAIGLSPSKIKTSEQRIRTHFFRFMRRQGYFEGYQETDRGWLRWARSSKGGAR